MAHDHSYPTHKLRCQTSTQVNAVSGVSQVMQYCIFQQIDQTLRIMSLGHVESVADFREVIKNRERLHPKLHINTKISEISDRLHNYSNHSKTLSRLLL